MAANAGRHVGPAVGANGESPSLPTDPLCRLEAELGASGRQPESERLHEETWRLLEEAWSLVTECLVIRDGLLEACQEVERTMGGIQDRLGAMAATIDPDTPDELDSSDALNNLDDPDNPDNPDDQDNAESSTMERLGSLESPDSPVTDERIALSGSPDDVAR